MGGDVKCPVLFYSVVLSYLLFCVCNPQLAAKQMQRTNYFGIALGLLCSYT